MTKDSLTPREHSVLARLVAGKTSTEIAAELAISPDTVREYIARIYRKLGVKNRVQCVLAALRNEWI